MNAVELTNGLIAAFRTQLLQVIGWLPGLAVGVALALLALVAGKLLEIATRSVLRRFGADRLAARLEVDRGLAAVGIHRPVSFLLDDSRHS